MSSQHNILWWSWSGGPQLPLLLSLQNTALTHLYVTFNYPQGGLGPNNTGFPMLANPNPPISVFSTYDQQLANQGDQLGSYLAALQTLQGCGIQVILAIMGGHGDMGPNTPITDASAVAQYWVDVMNNTNNYPGYTSTGMIWDGMAFDDEWYNYAGQQQSSPGSPLPPFSTFTQLMVENAAFGSRYIGLAPWGFIDYNAWTTDFVSMSYNSIASPPLPSIPANRWVQGIEDPAVPWASQFAQQALQGGYAGVSQWWNGTVVASTVDAIGVALNIPEHCCPQCVGICGTSDGCGGTCGGCETGFVCIDNQCVENTNGYCCYALGGSTDSSRDCNEATIQTCNSIGQDNNGQAWWFAANDQATCDNCAEW